MLPRSSLIDVDLDFFVLAGTGGLGNRADRLRNPALLADHLSHIVRSDMKLDQCHAVFLLFVDNLARLFFTSEIPLGILTSLIGAPFFVYLLFRRRRGWV